MLRIAAAVVGIWFGLGLVLALGVGRAGRRSGLESVIGAQAAPAADVARAVRQPDAAH